MVSRRFLRLPIKFRSPKGLFVRARLIVFLPIIISLIFVSALITQRHINRLTQLMSKTVADEIIYIQQAIDRAKNRQTALDDMAMIGKALKMQIGFIDTPLESRRYFFDYSGSILAAIFKKRIENFTDIDLVSMKPVRIGITTAKGLVEIRFDRDRATPPNTHQLFLLIIFVGLVMGIITLIFLNNQLKPIRNLAQASEAFGRGQWVDLRIRGAREVRAATQAFINMRRSIDKQIANRTLMISGISHDLRTPLTRLKLGLSFLKGEDVNALKADVDEMQNLIDYFLDFVRGDKHEALQEVDFYQFIADILDKHTLEGRLLDNPELRKEAAKNAPENLIWLRPIAIKRALDNLIENALRYGNRLSVSAVLTADSAILAVEDDGPGIAEKDYAKAIAPFSCLYQAADGDESSGVGLGLAIVDDIAQSHLGALELSKSARLGGLCAAITIARNIQTKRETIAKR